jgi:hypothetical protein
MWFKIVIDLLLIVPALVFLVLGCALGKETQK